MLKHFVITRLGLCVYNEQRLARMIDLFETITLSSLARQVSKHFVLLVVVDLNMPSTSRQRLEGLLSDHPNSHLVQIEVTQLLHVRHGCFDWVWEHCQEFLLGGGFLDDPYEYVITSSIDADDAWHCDVIRTVNHFISERLPHVCLGEEQRGTWLRHTSGIVATLPRGYKWFAEANLCEPLHRPFMSMAIFVAMRFSSGISVCSSRHRGWPSYSKVLAFEVSEIAQEREMWVYTRHGLATQPWTTRTGNPVGAPINDQLHWDFGIDLLKVQSWRKSYSTKSGVDAALHVYNGNDVSAQYDRIFKIAALNREIRALRCRQETQPNASILEKMAQTEGRRKQLVGTLQTEGAA